MPSYEGTVKRDYPRVNVMRGYTGNEPQSLSRSAPVSGGVTIKSGQAIALDASEEWVLATHLDAVVYIAYHDSDDTDVKSCGKLLGFSTLGSYELETAYTTSLGLAAATAAGMSVEVSSVTAGSLTVQGAGGGDDNGSVSLGRTSCAAVDLSNSQRGGYAVNLGEDDSSGSWGTSVSAVTGIWDLTIAGDANGGADTFAYTITLNGVDYAITATDWGTSNTATAQLVLAKIEAAQSNPLLDAAIESATETGGVITITTRAGTANNITVVGAYTDSGGTDPATGSGEVETQAGTDGTAATSKEVLRWVTTAS